MKPIGNIIFDLGEVLLNVDYHRTKNAFRALGIPHFEKLYSHAGQSGLFDLFETGKISPSEFRERMRGILARPVTDAQIDSAWNAMLLDLPQERLQKLHELKKEFRLFLLSNTNAIHFACWRKRLQDEDKLETFTASFEREYYSHLCGLRKPRKEVFLLILHENRLDPAETIFVDDTSGHVEGAKAAGLRGLYLEPGKTIFDIDFMNGKII